MTHDMEDNSVVIDDAVEAKVEEPTVDQVKPDFRQFEPPVRKLAIWYEAKLAIGATQTRRIFIDWAADIRLSQDLENVEREIVNGSNGEVVSALITHWRALEN